MYIRTLLYGYAVRNGQKVIVDEESRVVTEVFQSYLDGESLKHIAERLTLQGVIYYMDKATWNKNIISRIISDIRYCGNEEYPAIVSTELFGQVEKVRKAKSAVKAEVSPLLRLIKSKLVCERCGHNFCRVNKWGTREKWLCSSGCKFDIYLDDRYLIDGIYKSLINAAKSEVRAHPDGYGYKPSMEITRLTNEIYRMVELSKIEFKTVAEIILECASKRFDCCQAIENPEQLKAVFKEIQCMGDTLDETILENTVNQIFIDGNGNIKLFLKGEADGKYQYESKTCEYGDKN